MSRFWQKSGGLLRQIIRRLIRFYYGRIEITGLATIPGQGPILFVANHPNSLIDPVLVGIVARRPVHFLAKAPLFEMPVFGRALLALGMIPAFRGSDDRSQIARNSDSLVAGAEFLKLNEAVGIFPEGKSHDLTKIELIRSGAARIALNAYKLGATDITIVPLGLNYEKKERFRSAVWVQVGRPIKISEILLEEKEDERRAMRHLTNEIGKRLKEVVIHLEDDKWEHLLNDLEVLVPAPGLDGHTILRQRKRIADAINYFFKTNSPRALAMAEALNQHEQKLNEAGLPFNAALLRSRILTALPGFLRTVTWLFFGSLPAVIGTLHHLLPFAATRLLVKRLTGRNRSTIALTRLGLGLPIYTGWYALAWWQLADYFRPAIATVWICLMPFAGLVALNYWRNFSNAFLSGWPQFLILFRRGKLAELREERTALQESLAALTAEYLKAFPAKKPLSSKIPWGQVIRRTAIWLIILALLVGVTGWGFWRINKMRSSNLSAQGPGYSASSAAVIEEQLVEDEASLQKLLEEVSTLQTRSLVVASEFENGKRSFYRQEDDNVARQLILNYLNYRKSLLNLTWKYQNYSTIKDSSLERRAFLVYFASAASLYDLSFKLVHRFRNSPEIIRKLNEPEPLWEIPAGIYDQARYNLQQTETENFFPSANAAYRKLFPDAAALRPSEGAVPFHQAIERWSKTWSQRTPLLAEAVIKESLGESGKLGKNVTYRAQEYISTWLGNTRVRNPRRGQPLIHREELKQFEKKLLPGDILLERQNWYLSRAFMPGYWAHAALYVGTLDEMKQLGLLEDPRVLKIFNGLEKTSEDSPWVLEAVPSGVRLTTFHHCIGVADSAAVLRPSLSIAQRKEALARAFAHVGKPYDFNFDFFTTDKLVCTELVYRAYDGPLEFPLIVVMGRKTLPPTELVRKYVSEKKQQSPQLQFVCFLDGNERKGKAQFCDEKAFCKTLQRPSMTWLQPMQ